MIAVVMRSHTEAVSARIVRISWIMNLAVSCAPLLEAATMAEFPAVSAGPTLPAWLSQSFEFNKLDAWFSLILLVSGDQGYHVSSMGSPTSCFRLMVLFQVTSIPKLCQPAEGIWSSKCRSKFINLSSTELFPGPKLVISAAGGSWATRKEAKWTDYPPALPAATHFVLPGATCQRWTASPKDFTQAISVALHPSTRCDHG